MTRISRRSPLWCEGLEPRRLLASAGTLLSYDFNGAAAWPTQNAVVSSGVSATVAQSAVGTVDVAGGTTKTGAVALSVTAAPSNATWTGDLTSGQLALSNAETNLGKLTLAFQLSASQAESVRVIITSYDAGGSRTGALAGLVQPAAADSFQRFAVDLSTMAASGAGTFVPAAPFVSLTFEVGGALGWGGGASTLRVDNVNFARPAYYVSSIDGNDKDNGTTEALAFATIQKAINASQPGDIICVKGDAAHPYTVSAGNRNLITHGGTPAAWISIKNFPGQSPVISSEGWAAIQIGNDVASTAAAIGYVEIRGLHVIGDSAKVGSRAAPDGNYDPTAANASQYGPYAQYLQPVDPTTGMTTGGTADSRTNGNGLSVDGTNEANKPHDIRFADDVVEQCAGGGIGAGSADRIQIENNVVRDNCYWDKYGTSGISILSSYSFDATTGSVTRLIRNNVSSGNLHKEKWVRNSPTLTQYSDGNGIILDINHDSNGTVVNRSLVTNNVTFDNGGSGIHAYNADHVDIVNNTAYLNSASPYLQYGEIFANGAKDVRIYNNVLVAPVAPSGSPAEPVNGGTTPSSSNGIVYKDNVYYGGNTPAFAANAYNVGNVTADPKFVAPSTDPSVADFRLLASSPAINLGTPTLAPALDLIGQTRYANPDSGAYEFVPAAPTSITLAASSDTGTPGDDKTNLNNGSAASRLSFLVAGTLAGATVTLYANGVPIGSALAPAGTTTTTTTTAVTTDGATALADGTLAITAAQTFAGAPSAASPALNLTVQTVRPTLVGTPVINAGSAAPASRSQVRTVTWTFSEPVAAPLGAFTLTDRDTGVAVSLASRTLTLVGGNVLTLTLDTPGLDGGGGGAQLFLANANYALSLSPTAVADAAGNTLDPAAGTPTFDFFKLLGDFNGDRAVTGVDYLLWTRAYGQTAGLNQTAAATADACFDLNGDGGVTGVDYLLWTRQYGASLATAADGLFAAAVAVKAVAAVKSVAAVKVAAARAAVVTRRAAAAAIRPRA